LPGAAYFNFDISNETECIALVRETVKKFGRVDILINNAGAAKKWESAFAVNLLAPCVLMETAFEDMKKRGWGKIVNVTTSGVFSGGGDGLAYNATKGGLDSATRYLAKRYAKFGVAINAVAPGPTLTGIMRGYIGEEEFERHYLPTMPIGRILTPEDFAKTILFFCSPLSDAITGETILADGGRARLNPA
jgi:NAD(P)-dependent dehydrogenase (short-subunit alcohol dehydrogenase family)